MLGSAVNSRISKSWVVLGVGIIYRSRSGQYRGSSREWYLKWQQTYTCLVLTLLARELGRDVSLAHQRRSLVQHGSIVGIDNTELPPRPPPALFQDWILHAVKSRECTAVHGYGKCNINRNVHFLAGAFFLATPVESDRVQQEALYRECVLNCIDACWYAIRDFLLAALAERGIQSSD